MDGKSGCVTPIFFFTTGVKILVLPYTPECFRRMEKIRGSVPVYLLEASISRAFPDIGAPQGRQQWHWKLLSFEYLTSSFDSLTQD